SAHGPGRGGPARLEGDLPAGVVTLEDLALMVPEVVAVEVAVRDPGLDRPAKSLGELGDGERARAAIAGRPVEPVSLLGGDTPDHGQAGAVLHQARQPVDADAPLSERRL